MCTSHHAGASGAANSRSAPIPQLSGRAAGYAQAVCELNQAVADMQSFDTVAAMSAACSDEPPRAHQYWHCLPNSGTLYGSEGRYRSQNIRQLAL